MACERRIKLEELEGERRILLQELKSARRNLADKGAQVRQLRIEIQHLDNEANPGWTQSVVETRVEAKCEGSDKMEWHAFYPPRPLLCISCELDMGTEDKANLLAQECTIICFHGFGRSRVKDWNNCCKGCPNHSHSGRCNSNQLRIMDKAFRPPTDQRKQPQPALEDPPDFNLPKLGEGSPKDMGRGSETESPSSMDAGHLPGQSSRTPFAFGETRHADTEQHSE